MSVLRLLMRHFAIVAGLLFFALGAVAGGMAAQSPAAGRAATTAKAQALIDLTGYWVSLVNEDWRWRMMTPAKGDYASVPLNAEGKRVAGTWDPVKDEREGNSAGRMALATSCASRNVCILLGRTTILYGWTSMPGCRRASSTSMDRNGKGELPQLQGDSIAAWEKQVQRAGAVGRLSGAEPGKGGTLHVVTTHMKPGYLRKNGVPYSGDAVLTEYYDRFDVDGSSYLIVTSVVDDPKYLNDSFITSGQFTREPGCIQVESIPVPPVCGRS